MVEATQPEPPEPDGVGRRLLNAFCIFSSPGHRSPRRRGLLNMLDLQMRNRGSESGSGINPRSS